MTRRQDLLATFEQFAGMQIAVKVNSHGVNLNGVMLPVKELCVQPGDAVLTEIKALVAQEKASLRLVFPGDKQPKGRKATRVTFSATPNKGGTYTLSAPRIG